MNQLISFISEHIIPISIVMLPILYLSIRDIFLFFRKKRSLKAMEVSIQEKQANIDALISQLNKNRTELAKTFKNIADLEASYNRSANQNTDISNSNQPAASQATQHSPKTPHHNEPSPKKSPIDKKDSSAESTTDHPSL
mgnify:CR=1 FL=1